MNSMLKNIIRMTKNRTGVNDIEIINQNNLTYFHIGNSIILADVCINNSCVNTHNMHERIFYSRGNKLGVGVVKSMLKYMIANNYDDGIIITDSITNQAVKFINSNHLMELYSPFSVCCPDITHALTPKYYKIDAYSQEFMSVMSAVKDLELLPKLKFSDPMFDHMQVECGDVICVNGLEYFIVC